MEVNVIHADVPNLFNTIIFPEQHQVTRRWIDEQFNRGGQLLTDLGQQFMNSARAIHAEINDPNIRQMARRAARTVKGIFHPNQIYAIDSIFEAMAAKPIMQRYIMAEPEIRSLYHRQLCDGYSDSYVDMAPGKIGDDHYDYRRVMQDVVTFSGEDNEQWSVSHYFDDLHPEDRELDDDEQFAILHTWDVIRAAIKAKKDPTDIFGGELEL